MRERGSHLPKWVGSPRRAPGIVRKSLIQVSAYRVLASLFSTHALLDSRSRGPAPRLGSPFTFMPQRFSVSTASR